jgi:hypothetical protein
MGISSGAAGFLLHGFCSVGYGQISGLTNLANRLEDLAPRYFKSLSNFGLAILEKDAQSFFTSWLKPKTASPSPGPNSFSEKFNPSHLINVGATQAFQHQTALPARTLLVDRLPHILATAAIKPTDLSSLNAAEMDEMANKGNSLLWHQQCGCLARIPLTDQSKQEPREQPTKEHTDEFYSAAYNGEIPITQTQLGTTLASLRTNVSLDYVRDFCGCYDNTPIKLRGFAYRDDPYGRQGKFAIRKRA